MITAVEAIYEDGLLRPFSPFYLPERTHVRLTVEVIPDDPDRAAWMTQSEHKLREVWDNDGDNIYNELLPP